MILLPATTIYLAMGILWLCLAAATAFAARMLDRDPLAWLGIGLVFGLLALIALALLGRPDTARRDDDVKGPEYDAIIAARKAAHDDEWSRKMERAQGIVRPIE